MNPTVNPVNSQQNHLRSYRENCNSYRFFNLLTSDALLDKVDELLPAHRERRYPPTETLSMFLAQAMCADRSCQNAVNQAAMQRLKEGFSAVNTYTGGYCRARQRLPLTLVTQLTRYLSELIDDEVPVSWRWKGRRVRIVDGTTVTMPDTNANQAEYPQQRGQQQGLGFPICRLVGITCLSSGALINTAVGHFKGKGGDEQTLLRSLQDTFQESDLILGDAFFATYFFIADMQAKGVDILMEQHGARRKSTDFRRGKKLGQRDHLIQLNKPKKRPDWMSTDQYHASPETITVRELKAGGKVMVTTLECARTFPKDALKSLYKSRWHVELDIRHIKDTMEMNVLSCKTPEMVKKEIWVYMLAYNLLRFMMTKSALLADLLPRNLSFKHCLQLWMNVVQVTGFLSALQFNELLRLISQQQVGKQPGRTEPRAVKRRPKAYPLLTKPRKLASEEVRKYGHPKKLK